MSKPSLAGREQQQSSPFGLRHKQAKKAKKIRSKCATVAPYLLCARLGSRPPTRERGKNKKNYGANAPYLHHIQKNTEQTRHICTIFFLRGERELLVLLLMPPFLV